MHPFLGGAIFLLYLNQSNSEMDYYLWLFKWEMSSIDYGICIVHPQLVVLFGKLMEHFRGRALLDEVRQWEGESQHWLWISWSHLLFSSSCVYEHVINHFPFLLNMLLLSLWHYSPIHERVLFWNISLQCLKICHCDWFNHEKLNDQ